jgi:hypothetical protein
VARPRAGRAASDARALDRETFQRGRGRWSASWPEERRRRDRARERPARGREPVLRGGGLAFDDQRIRWPRWNGPSARSATGERGARLPAHVNLWRRLHAAPASEAALPRRSLDADVAAPRPTLRAHGGVDGQRDDRLRRHERRRRRVRRRQPLRPGHRHLDAAAHGGRALRALRARVGVDGHGDDRLGRAGSQRRPYPATDTWRPMSTVNAPTGRWDAAWCGRAR